MNLLTFVEYTSTKNGKRLALFSCDCGSIVEKRVNDFNSNRVKSCGCLRRLKNKTNPVKHGDSGKNSRNYMYTLWSNIKKRCLDPKSDRYKDYGGRGIRIYVDWIDDYTMFKDWILNNIGERPDGKSLDRINNNKGYEPNNLRWATQSEQNYNKRPKSY